MRKVRTQAGQQRVEDRLRALTAKQAPQIKRTASDAFLNARDRVSLADLRAALATGQAGTVEGAAQYDKLEKDLGPIVAGILAALLLGGKSAADEIDGPGFDSLAGTVQNAVAAQAAKAVARVVSGSRQGLRQAVQRIVGEELDLDKGAQDLRNALALTAPMERSLALQRIAMEQAGTKDSVVERALKTRADRMAAYRASVIADNETFTAVSLGRDLYWAQLAASGDLPPGQQREWVTASDEKVCPVCKPMDGQRRGLNEFFTTGEGDLITAPPTHVTCRCSVVLVSQEA